METLTRSSAMFQLRPYQEKAIVQVHSKSKAGARILMFAPTGAGKTIIATRLIADYSAQGKKVMFVVPRNTLVQQTANKLHSVITKDGTPLSFSFIKAGYPYNPKAQVFIASIQTYHRRKDSLNHKFDVIVLDECHYSCAPIYDAVFENPNNIIIGLTATPFNLNKKKPLYLRYTDYVATIQTVELIEQKYLSPLVIYGYPKDAIRRKNLINNPCQISTEDSKDIKRAFDSYVEKCNGHRFIIFARSVEHSMIISEYFTKNNVPCAHIDANTPEILRQSIFRNIREGALLGVSSVGVLSEGFDEPSISVCIMARPTLSRSLYIQQAGRVLRVYPGKETAYLIDLAGNVWQHGTPLNTIDVNLTADDELGINEEAQGLVVCPACGAINSLENTVCYLCQHPLSATARVNRPRGKKAKKIVDSKVVQIDHSQCINIDYTLKNDKKSMIANLIAVSTVRGYRKGWVVHQAKSIYGSLTPELMAEICKQLGYKMGWIRNFL